MTGARIIHYGGRAEIAAANAEDRPAVAICRYTAEPNPVDVEHPFAVCWCCHSLLRQGVTA